MKSAQRYDSPGAPGSERSLRIRLSPQRHEGRAVVDNRLADGRAGSSIGFLTKSGYESPHSKGRHSIILSTGMSRGTSKTGLVGEARSVAEASTTAEAIKVRIDRLDWEDVARRLDEQGFAT